LRLIALYFLLLTVLLAKKGDLQTLYFLPDDSNILVYEIKKRVANADNFIYLMSKELDYQKLFTAIRKPLNRAIPVVIVKDISSEVMERLKLYRDAKIFSLKNVEFSAVSIDNKYLFVLPSSINRDSLEKSYSIAIESREPKAIKDFEKSFSAFVRRAIELENSNK
jgi:hypothetical protein